jgi:hypothetical protein
MTLAFIPPAQIDEHQYWTDPILCEETRSQEDRGFYIQHPAARSISNQSWSFRGEEEYIPVYMLDHNSSDYY